MPPLALDGPRSAPDVFLRMLSVGRDTAIAIALQGLTMAARRWAYHSLG
ncbi:hypothetical protein CyaNS01_01827 [Cyanobium sp. NS01]|nr:hypothetical protein CyaNS01_01827 [Cyanobium sp. NS01]